MPMILRENRKRSALSLDPIESEALQAILRRRYGIDVDLDADDDTEDQDFQHQDSIENSSDSKSDNESSDEVTSMDGLAGRTQSADLSHTGTASTAEGASITVPTDDSTVSCKTSPSTPAHRQDVDDMLTASAALGLERSNHSPVTLVESSVDRLTVSASNELPDRLDAQPSDSISSGESEKSPSNNES